MARRIFADFDLETQQRLQNRTDITSTQRGFFINDAVRMIANEFPHPEFDKYVDDTIPQSNNDYWTSAVATDLWWPKFLKDTTNNRPIDLVAQEKIEGYRKVAGLITQFYWFAGQFFWDRIPAADTNIRLWYKKLCPEYTSGSPLFNQIFDPLVPMRAAQIALSTVGDQTAAMEQQSEYMAYVNRERLPTYENQRNDRRQALTVRMR